MADAPTATTEAPVTDAPAAAPETGSATPAQAAPALPPDWTPERAEKAFKANRHQDRKLKEREAALAAKERELTERYQPKLTAAEKMEQLLARAREGDEDAEAELGLLDYDTRTRRRLMADPVTDKLTALEKKLQDREQAEKTAREQAETAAAERAVQQDCETFAAIAHEKNGDVEAFEHLAVYDRAELAELAPAVAEKLAELMGRAPTFAEMCQSLNEAFARRHERIIARHEARRASATPAGKAGTAPVEKKPTTPTTPATLTNAHAGESSTPQRSLTREEREARRREIERGWQQRA